MSQVFAAGRRWCCERLSLGVGLLLAVSCQDAASDTANPVVAAARPGPASGGMEAAAGTAGAAGPPEAASGATDCPGLPAGEGSANGCVNTAGLGAELPPASMSAPGMADADAAVAASADAAAPAAELDAGAPVAPEPPRTFSPCPLDGSPCVVMPFGDSITEGYPTFNGGYRVELFHRALLDGHSLSFVGARVNGPATVDGQPFPRGNEGYSGYTIEPSQRMGISVRAEPAIAMYRPHIILLMIGTNDIDLNVDVANAPARLGALIDRITSAAPAALLVVAQILPTSNAATNQRIQAFDAAIPGLVASRSAAGKHVIGVDMYTAFTSNPDFANAYLVDALHPNPAGYALLGQRWYAAVLPYLP